MNMNMIASSVLNSAVSQQDPIQFVTLEQMLKTLAHARVPRWSPSLMFSPSRWRQRKLAQQTARMVEEECERAWQNMARIFLTAQNNLIDWQANQRLREMMFAEQLRNMRQVEDMRLEMLHRELKIRDTVAAGAEERAFKADIAKMDRAFDHKFQLLQIEESLKSPVHRAERQREAIRVYQNMLDDIDRQNGVSAIVKDQLASMVMDLARL